MKDYKCVKGIEQKNCLEYCNQHNKCVGVEWNKQFNNNNKVCCPYKKIGEMTPRQEAYKYGRFYRKN